MTEERNLTARSVIASLLLGMRPPRLSGARLVAWCGIFGISAGTARVALHRMVERDELMLADAVYELAGRMRDRQPAQEWSLVPKLGRWSGTWRMGAVVAAARTAAERAALRDAMRRCRFAELREGLWVRPDNVPRAAAPAAAWHVADEQCTWWTGRPEEDPLELAAALFAAPDWARHARALRTRLAVVTTKLPGSERDLADAFLVGAAALAHIRADPLLPRALCPEPWSGEELRAAYLGYQQRFSAAARAWFRRTA
ncbi:MAG: PaaX family transcriptional regulator C-terminal domain-containing protein [Actinomycetota bacterium]